MFEIIFQFNDLCSRGKLNSAVGEKSVIGKKRDKRDKKDKFDIR